MNAVERVEERLQRAMEGLLREFEADGIQPEDCAFAVVIVNGSVNVGRTNDVRNAIFGDSPQPEPEEKLKKRK